METCLLNPKAVALSTFQPFLQYVMIPSGFDIVNLRAIKGRRVYRQHLSRNQFFKEFGGGEDGSSSEHFSRGGDLISQGAVEGSPKQKRGKPKEEQRLQPLTSNLRPWRVQFHRLSMGLQNQGRGLEKETHSRLKMRTSTRP